MLFVFRNNTRIIHYMNMQFLVRMRAVLVVILVHFIAEFSDLLLITCCYFLVLYNYLFVLFIAFL